MADYWLEYSACLLCRNDPHVGCFVVLVEE